MTGKGLSHGAITVINAMPTGIGATIGIELKTHAEFTPGGDSRKVRIINDPNEDSKMAEYCVADAFARMEIPEPAGWTLTVNSEIPVSRGLKSSSSACNAILSAVFDEYGYSIDGVSLIKIGVGCAKKAGVTVTGSFDDACGCHFGGLVITDNAKNSIIFQDDIGDYDVILHVPEKKIRKSAIDRKSFDRYRSAMESAIGIADTYPFNAMVINGRIIAESSGLDNSVAEDALSKGALAAGVTGSGPAVAVIVEPGSGRGFAKNLGADNVIVTKTRRLHR
ncbi:MAG: shikimate kinase [Candidatus Methanomethylophilaceae archaeon]|nr:shikimate kinase [Candidatus Methanomethylophilaceae archaeon]